VVTLSFSGSKKAMPHNIFKKAGGWIGYGLIAAFTLAMVSGGMGSMLWAVFACSAIFFINSASVGAEVSKGQFLAIHLKDGIFAPTGTLSCAYL
jgi:hypothetical protein